MNELTFGYCFTDFQSRMKQGGYSILKCLSFIINDPQYGGMIFDTGSPTDTQTLVAQIKAMGMSIDDVKWIFCSHVHPDHMGGNTTFPNATVVLSKRDFDFSTGIANVAFSGGDMLSYLLEHCPGYRNSYGEFEASATVGYIKDYWSPHKIGLDGKHVFLEDAPVLPHYIKPIFTPGHTFFHYSYQLELCQKLIYVTGDAISNRFVLGEDKQYRMKEPHMDFDAYFASVAKFQNKDALIIPGHDRPFFTTTGKTIRKNVFTLQQIIS